MKIHVVRAGDSPCIPVPEALLARSGLEAGERVEIEAFHGRLVIRRSEWPRQGWEEAFRSMAERGDDTPLD